MAARHARVRLIRTEDGQRLDIPFGFMLGGDEALLRAEDGRLVVEPIRHASLLAVLDGLETLDEDWPGIDDPVPDDVRL